MISLLLLACQQSAQAPSALSNPPIPGAFSIPPAIAESVRLSTTPKLDGKMGLEEWDPLAVGSVESFQQWEPGRVHLAARTPIGQDVVVSLDLKGDGWLHGADNVELRIKWNGAAPETSARVLDGTRPEAPAWVDASNIVGATKVAAAAEGDKWVAEVSMDDPGIKLLPEKSLTAMGVRFDAVAPTEALDEAYLPRAMGMVTLAMDRGKDLPTGFRWAPQFRGRSVVPGESFRIRLTFNGNELLNFKRIDMRTEGLGMNETTSMGVPFPAFDRKNRAFVDYEAGVQADAEPGWRVLRGTIIDGAGKATVVQTSYEIGPLVQFDFQMPKGLKSSEEPQVVRLSTWVRSNTKKRINGIFRVGSSDVFTVENGSDKPFIIYNARGSKRQVFEVKIPGGFKGTLPVKLVADIGAITHEETVWLTVP